MTVARPDRARRNRLGALKRQQRLIDYTRSSLESLLLHTQHVVCDIVKRVDLAVLWALHVVVLILRFADIPVAIRAVDRAAALLLAIDIVLAVRACGIDQRRQWERVFVELVRVEWVVEFLGVRALFLGLNR